MIPKLDHGYTHQGDTRDPAFNKPVAGFDKRPTKLQTGRASIKGSKAPSACDGGGAARAMPIYGVDGAPTNKFCK